MSTTTRRLKDEEEITIGDGFAPTGAAAEKDTLAQQYNDMTYDSFTKGADYKSLENRYTHGGQKAMNDTMASLAARTGGIASSYAAAAGQQQYNDYMSRLEDAARSLYDSQRGELKDKLDYATGEWDTQYKNYWDEQDREYERNTAAQTDAQTEFLTQLDAGVYPTDIELRDIAEATGWDIATINAYISDSQNKESENAAVDADKKLEELVASGMTWDQINGNRKYRELMNASSYGKDYWEQQVNNEKNNKEYSPRELYAQDDIMAYIASGTSVSSLTDDEIKATGKSRKYWEAYAKVLKNPTEDVSMLSRPDQIELWTDSVRDAKSYTDMKIYCERLSQLDLDLAFTLQEEWENAHPDLVPKSTNTPSTNYGGRDGKGISNVLSRIFDW